jgi:hypothetical protein
MLTNAERCTSKVTSRIAIAKALFCKKRKKKKNFFTSKFDLNLRKNLIKC